MPIKVSYKDDMRRFDDCPYAELRTQVQNRFPELAGANWGLTYTDPDGDHITVASDMELAEALSLAGAGALRLVAAVKGVATVSPKPVVPKPVENKQSPQPASQPVSRGPEVSQAEVLRRVVAMPSDFGVRGLCQQYHLDVVKVAWEDTARSLGSAVGPNISDMTLRVEGKSLPLVRSPNFADSTWDVPIGKIQCIVGNHDASQSLRTCALDKILKQPWEVSTLPFGTTLWHERDTHVLVQAQACFLPIAQHAETKFNLAIQNYQSTHSDPACLVITATSKGTSFAVTRGGITIIHFDDRGTKRSFLGQRLKDNRAERGVALEGAMSNEEKQENVIIVIQVPLKLPVANPFGFPSVLDDSMFVGFGPAQCGFGLANMHPPPAPACFAASDGFGGGGAFSARRLAKSQCEAAAAPCDVDNAIVKLAEAEGPYPSLAARHIQRDERFPIRVTLQFYKSTSNGVVNSQVVSEIAAQFSSARSKAEGWGSLVLDNPGSRATEVKAPSPAPQWVSPLDSCPRGHPLGAHYTPAPDYRCDQCMRSFPVGSKLMGCRPCNWDVCIPCCRALRGARPVDAFSGLL